MHFLIEHQPGRSVALLAAYRLKPHESGPVSLGIRMNFNKMISVTGVMDLLPFGVSLGLNYSLKGFRIRGCLDHRAGPGLSPVLEFGSE
jgi:hypothetical protein